MAWAEGLIFLYFYRKMDTPQRCQYCSLYFHPSDMDEHLNLHQHPTDLKPKTQGHGMQRMKYSNSAHVDAQDDSSDIALRSLMPDEIPQDQKEKQRVGLADNDDNFGNNGGDPNANQSEAAKFKNYRNRDRLDLNSNLANNSLSNRDQLNKLNIEKQVELKTVKTMVPKKEIRKYKNDPYSTKQIRDLGYSEKKDHPEDGYALGAGDGRDRGNGYNRDHENKNYEGDNEPGYKVSRDNTYQKNPVKKEAIYVPMTRVTSDPGDYNAIDTKVNGDNGPKYRREYGEESSENDEFAKNKRSQYGEGQGQSYGETSRVENYPVGNGDNHRSKHVMGENEYHDHGNHPHECPDCHGFWCRTCGATIPPQYRPFWDEDESPQMVEYYKKRIRQERERERRKRGECNQCNHPGSHKESSYKEEMR